MLHVDLELTMITNMLVTLAIPDALVFIQENLSGEGGIITTNDNKLAEKLES